MDDDDYYPPQRVSHAVETLLANPKALCAGSSEMHCYFKHINKMYQFGPYGPNHATAATFAFRRELLNQTKYDDEACLAEEKQFLKQYTIPFVQLETTKTILIFSHDQNTFDKKILISGDASGNPFVKESTKQIADFIKEKDITQFFTVDIDKQLEKYKPGSLENKPDCIKQLGEIKEKRELQTQMQQMQQQMQQMHNYIQQLQQEIQKAQHYIAELNEEKKQLSEKNDHLNKKITELITRRIEESRVN
jgi:lipopolysaccharide export LptBFGC system permease protein LptF